MRTILTLILATCFLLALTASPTQAQVCTPAPPLPPVVKIAILVFCNGPVGVLSTNPLFDANCTADTTASGLGTVRTFQYGIDMYVKAMQAQQPMPLRDSTNVSFSFTYVNLGYINWANPVWTSMYAVTGNETSGLFWDILTTTKYNGPFAFVVPPILIKDPMVVTLANICEDQNACIVLNGFMSAPNLAQCLPATTGAALPADCIRRGRVEGMRRFANLFGVLFDSMPVAYSALDTYHTLGVKTIAVVAEGPYFALFPQGGFTRTIEQAKQLNIKVVSSTVMVLCDPNTFVPALNGTNCPRYKKDGTPAVAQSQILPNGQSATDFAATLKELNPDAIVMIGSSSGQAFHTFASLYDGFRAVGWTPKMINWAGGVDASLRPYMTDYNDLLYTWTTAPWDSRLTGPQYRNVKTAANFELYPAETDLDAPQIFAREYNKNYGKYFTGGTYNFLNAGTVLTVLGYQALTFGQKMVEMALSASVPSLLSASLKVSTPSVYHQLQFDLTGRTALVNQMLLQFKPAATPSPTTSHALTLISPYNIGETPVYPIPTWDERVFSPVTYGQSNEQMMAGITSVCILICLIVCALLLSHAKHQVIRAATPSFCIMTILGAIFMLMSNYFNTLVASDNDCSAQVWLLTLGFTLLFSALFVKTFRIWKIFYSSQKLQVVKMKDVELLVAVAAFLLVDIIINAAWQGSVGMSAQTIVTDPLRPSLNYIECKYDGALGFIYAHLAIKCGLLLFGICLTWLVRNTPSQFNESSFIGICIYNVSIVICFVIPILAKQLGGRDTTYLIRAFAIMFVTLTSTLVLYIPKLMGIYNIQSGSGRVTHAGDETTNTSQQCNTMVKAYSKDKKQLSEGTTAGTPMYTVTDVSAKAQQRSHNDSGVPPVPRSQTLMNNLKPAPDSQRRHARDTTITVTSPTPESRGLIADSTNTPHHHHNGTATTMSIRVDDFATIAAGRDTPILNQSPSDSHSSEAAIAKYAPSDMPGSVEGGQQD